MKRSILIIVIACFFVAFNHHVHAQQRRGQNSGVQSTKPPSQGWRVTREVVIPEGPLGESSMPVISPNHRRIAQIVKRDDRYCVFVDGVAGREYDTVSTIAFSPDSKRVAYFAAFRGLPDATNPNEIIMKAGGWWTLVVDGVESEIYADVDIKSLCFSPDSKRIAFAARLHTGGQGLHSVTGQIKPGYSNRKISASLQAKGPGGEWALIVDGKAGTIYSAIDNETIV